MAFHERRPIALGSPRRWVKAVADHDFLDCVDGHVDPELLQFALNPGVTPAILLCHAEDDRGDVVRDRRAARFAFRSLRVFSIKLLPDPSQERLVVDDPEKFLDRAAQRRAKTNQKRAFGGRGLDGFREPGAQDAILGFEIGDLAQEHRLGHVNQKCEQWVVTKIGHRKKPKRMATQPIFGYGKHLEFRPPIRDRPKTGFSEAARERNKVFAYSRRTPFCQSQESW